MRWNKKADAKMAIASPPTGATNNIDLIRRCNQNAILYAGNLSYTGNASGADVAETNLQQQVNL
jgi:hypothetical protein